MKDEDEQRMPEENGGCVLGDQLHKGLTIRGVFELWLTAARKEVNAASYANYERIVRRHILPRLGEAVVDYLTVADIRDFLDERLRSGRMDGKGGLSRKTVADISRVLNAGLKLVNWDPDLSDDGRIFVKSMHPKRDTDTLTDRQAAALTEYLTENLDRSNAGFLLCLYTGIKLSEICALRDSDFLLEEDRLQVRRTLQRVTMRQSADEPEGSGGRQDTVAYDPGDSGYRDLALATGLSMLLWTLLRGGDGTAYFLTGTDEQPLGPRTYQYRFQSMLSSCGLPQTVNFHMLRHTFALMWMSGGGEIGALSRALGHGSVKTTQARYEGLLQTVEPIAPDHAKLICPSAVQ